MSETKPNQTHKTLGAALVAAQRDATENPLDADGTYSATSKRTNERTSYKYPTAVNLCDWARKHLNRHGVCVTLGTALAQPVVVGNRVLLPFAYAVEHEGGESRQHVAWWPVVESDYSDLYKNAANSDTRAERYVLMRTLCVRAVADDDEPFTGTSARESAEAALPPPPPLPSPRPSMTTNTAKPIELTLQSISIVPAEAPPKAAPLPPPAPAPGATASTTAPASAGEAGRGNAASGAAAHPPPPPAPTAGPRTAPTETQEQRNARMVAAVDATGMPGAAFSQYVCETVIPGCADLTALDAASAEKVIAAAAALKARPLAPGEVARLEAAWNAPEAQPPLPPPAPAGGADFPFGKNAPALPPPTTPAKCVLDDPALAARWAVFKRDASQARVAKGLTSEALIPIANQWARRPGLLAAGKALEGRAGTEGEVTAEVLSLLEAGLAEWKKEPATAGVGR